MHIAEWMRSRFGVALLAAVSTAVVTGGISAAALPSAGATIHGCYSSTDGYLRVVDPQNQACQGDETAISWNQEGQVGAAGDAGAQGERGEPGPAGDPGVLALAGKSCPIDASVTGFDESGNLLCSDGTTTQPEGEPEGTGEDGDGLTDADDCAPTDPNPPGAEECFAPASVYDLTSKAVTGNALISELLVTAVTRSGSAAWVAAQPGDDQYQGAEGSAIKLVLTGMEKLPSVAIGDRLTAYGAVRQTAGHVELVADGLEVSSSGENVSPAVEVTAEELVGNVGLDGVLVSLTGWSLGTIGEGGWVTSAGITLDRTLMGEFPMHAVGTTFASVVGVAQTAQSTGTALLLPRVDEDFVIDAS